MKKLTILVLLLAMLTAFDFAEVGLTAGLEVGFDSVNTPDKSDYNGVDASDTLYILPFITFEKTLAKDFDLSADLGLYMPAIASDADFSPEIWADVKGTYTVNLSDAQSLGFGLGIAMQTANLAGNDLGGVSDRYFNFQFIPFAKFTQTIKDTGSFYALLQLIAFADNNDATDFNMGLNALVGFNFDFGLGIEAGLAADESFGFVNGVGFNFGLGDTNGDAEVQWLKIKPSYTYKALYAYAEVFVPLFDKGIDDLGITINPGVEVSVPGVDGLGVYAEAWLTQIGAADLDLNIGFCVGVTYSF